MGEFEWELEASAIVWTEFWEEEERLAVRKIKGIKVV